MSSLTGASPQPPIESRHNGLRRIFVRFAPWVALTAAAVLLSGTAFGMPLIPVAAVLLGALYCSLGANIGIAIAAGLFYGLLSLGVAEPAWFEWIAMYLLSLGLAGLLWQQRNQLRQRVAAGEAELERAQSEKQAMLAAVMTMPIGMTFSSPDDAQFTVRYANPAFGAISGYPPEALIGYDFRMLFGPDSDPTAVKRLQAALHERRATQAVLCLQGGDGRSFWSDIALAPVYMPNGNFVGMISLYQDISARRADEERLQILERQIKLILRTIPEQFWLKDCAGRYLLVSEALAQFHGLSSDAMIGRTATELYPANLADFITAGDKHVFEYGQNYYAERLISGPDGQQYWFDSSRTPVYDDNSKLIGLVGLARDISRRKANEANLARQLRYAEALARCSQVLLASSTAAEDLAANVTDAIAELRSALDVSRVVVYQYSSLEANAQMSCLAATVAPHDPEPLLVPVTWGEAPPELIAALHARRAFGGPTAGRYRDYPQFQAMFDRNMILSWLAVPIFLGERLWGHIGVSERREPCEWDSPLVQFLNTAAEMIASFVRRLETLEALQQRESHLRAVRDAMPDPLFTLHADGRLSDLHLTPDSRLVAEAERHEILSIDHLIADTSVQILRQAATAACRSNAVQQCELHAGSPADQAIYEARLAPINATEVLVVIRDVTERERVAEQLRHAATVAAAADRAKSAFLAHMSHEIRTPLNAVIGMAELLRESSLPAETQAALETIMIGGETLLGLVNDILDLARIEAGHLDIDRKPFDIRGAIESSALLIRQKAEEKGLDLRITIAPALPHYVLGDAMRLRQILVNLLANAIKFTPGGYVAIEARYQADTGEMSILVSDSGIGIASDQLEAIFAPFVQDEGQARQRQGGTGLGLSISRQLATLMGGRLAVVSTPGFGSTFSLHLPITVGQAPIRTSAPAARFRSPRNLLVVEDNPINQMVIRSMLEQLACPADIVASGEAALAALEQKTYDAILMDIQLPGISGVETTRAIRARGDQIVQPHIIALTASAIAGDRDRYLEAGLDDYLSKPIRIDQLRSVLNVAPQTATINWAHLDTLAQHAGASGHVQLRRLIGLFAAVFPQQLDELEAASDRLDRDAVSHIAHMLRGGSSQVGAECLSEACGALEARVAGASAEQIRAMVSDIRVHFGEALTLLKKRYEVQEMIDAEDAAAAPIPHHISLRPAPNTESPA